jgi:hypothetical protein
MLPKEDCMLIMERTMVDFVSAPEAREHWGLEAETKSMAKRLLQLDHQAWMGRLTNAGFSPSQILDLDAVVHKWTSQLDWDDLAKHFANCDLDDEDEIERGVTGWLQHIPQNSMPEQITRGEDFPSRFDALCYAVNRLGRMIDSSVEFERMRKEPDAPTEMAKPLTPEQQAIKKSWAEAGLAEDVQAWPRY